VFFSDFLSLLVLVEELEVLDGRKFTQTLLCKHRDSQKLYVLKRIFTRDKNPELQGLLDQWKLTARQMTNFHSDYVIQVYGSFEDRNYTYLVTKYCRNGNLQTFLKNREAAGKPLTHEVSPFFFFM
jgi:serine/threonine protein kinase